MIYQAETVFWCDISMLALEAAMSEQGDTRSNQYVSVKNRALQAIQRLSSAGHEKQLVLRCVSHFMDVRKSLISHSEVDLIEEGLIPGTIVALCVRNSANEEISDDTLGIIIENATTIIES